MLLNKIEFLFVNNPIRAFIQEKLEIKRLRKLSNLPSNKVILEIWCWNGMWTRIIKKYFMTKEIYAIDLDEKMISIAKDNNSDTSIYFDVWNATKLNFESNKFDAIIDFCVIHHIVEWKDCLKELKRVLKPWWELILEDLSIDTFDWFVWWLMKKIFNHPYESMYKKDEFLDYLEKFGFKIVEKQSYNQLIKYFVIIAKK